ncbi:uncharacterized protein C18orf19 homolog A isoform X2 [Scleropages formosus]|uniref:uncharacterized protein C18orf19 homolog A isoform X2 n=1 Tax=Scleropages formosus TaxID=113540 RepID=UPI00087877FD|nr:uncharacterized protein C18orf19 homolog A-like isoform X2 [Scleropages formosus]
MQRILFHGAPQQAAVALRCALSVTTLSYVAPKPSKLSGTCSWTPSPRWLRTSAATKTAKRSKRGIDEEQQTAGNPGQDHGAQGASPGASPANSTNGDPLQDKSIGLTQRFKKTFKQGVNVVPFLEYVGFPEKLVSLMEKSQSGYAITAYAMFKMATPARYTVTLAGTSLSVKYLRRHGYMSTPPPVKEYLQDKMEETRERLSEKMGETKDKLSEKLQETKDKVSFRKKTE